MFRDLTTDGFVKPKAEFSPGPAPVLIWLEIKDLVIDDTYQRDIGRRGRINVNRIAERFDWSKFAPVIVAPVEGGRFAIVSAPRPSPRARRPRAQGRDSDLPLA